MIGKTRSCIINVSVDHAWNEISLRYIDASDFDYYTPAVFRRQSRDNKQASANDPIDDPAHTLKQAYQDHSRQALALYRRLLAAGVAREQARGVLPLNIYTEFYWTASLQAVVNFIQLRKHETAQFEIRQYADAVETLTAEVVPVSYRYLLNPDAR